MINWLVIGAFLIIGLLVIKFSHAEKKFKLIAVILILALVYFSATAVLTKNNIKLDSADGVGKAISVYFSWLGNAATNIWHAGGQVKTIVGNAIKTNSTG